VVFFLCCWLALGGSCWVDLLAWVGGPDVLGGARPACVGLGLFGIFQSMLLGRSHFRSLAEADGLNERLRGKVRDLEERQGEIATLNEELRRQIGRRTADILSALTRSGGSAQFDPSPGHLVAARYRIVRTLGAGGMGTVYEVERLSDGKHLALKVALEVRGLALARLAREAQIATRVHHPNVVSIVDADVAEAGYAYIVLELVAGSSLADCPEGRPLPWCLEVLLQVLEGVRALHAQGVVHRDLKPSNILLSGEQTDKPLVKITDFGISRWLEDEPSDRSSRQAMDAITVQARKSLAPPTPAGAFAAAIHAATPTAVDRIITDRGSSPREPSSSPQLTRTGSITGTPLYVAPELADGPLQLTPAVDVFSFGVVAYRLLTRQMPYVEAPLHARLAGRESPAPIPLAALCPALSPTACAAIDACLSPMAAERPTVDVLVAVLAAEKVRAGDGALTSGAARSP
jgi:serine/threonine protein kinase